MLPYSLSALAADIERDAVQRRVIRVQDGLRQIYRSFTVYNGTTRYRPASAPAGNTLSRRLQLAFISADISASSSVRSPRSASASDQREPDGRKLKKIKIRKNTMKSDFTKSDSTGGKPNILLISADQLRARELCVPEIPGRPCCPNLRAMAERGVTFDTAVTPSPVCTPARTALFSGQYEPLHGPGDNAPEPVGGASRFPG